MKAIILAAGQSSRLGDICKDLPKCLVSIEDNTLLEIQINTLYNCGIEDITVIRGYKGEKIDIPGLKYYDNPDFAETNMLHSLFCARGELNNDLLIIYSDILFEPQVIERMLESTYDIAAGVMVNWEEAIEQRDSVALEDMEMVSFDSENRVLQIGKSQDESDEMLGQFIGILKCSCRGAQLLKKNYDRLETYYKEKSFGRAEVFKNAWLTDMLQDMAYFGVPVNCVIYERGWLEIDTPEDYERACNDMQFVRRLVKKKTDWTVRAELYNGLDWVSRDELLSKMVEVAGDVDAKNVLDVGTGTGKVLMALHSKYPDAEYTGVDISPAMIDKIDPSYGFSLMIRQMEDLHGLKDDSYDLVTARMVFHHADDLTQATREVYRVLKPGGRFILCEGTPPDHQTLNFYKEMFRFKEDRHSFLQDDLVNLLAGVKLKNLLTHTILMKDMSLNNWLDNSGLPFRNVDIIKRMHLECDQAVQRAYQMKHNDGDIFMNWKFAVVTGTK